MAEQKWFWLKWPPHKQQRFFKVAKWAWLLILVGSFGPQYFLTVSTQKQIERQKALYASVVPIAKELRSIRLRQAEQQQAAPRQVVADMAEKAGIGWERISFDQKGFEFTHSGVRVTLNEVTLLELTTFLKGLRDNSGLYFLDFTLERNPFNSMLADVTMTLVR